MKLLFFIGVPVIAVALPAFRTRLAWRILLWLFAASIAGWLWYKAAIETHDVAMAFGIYFATIATWPVVISLALFFSRLWWTKIKLPILAEFAVLLAICSAALIFFILDINRLI